MNNTIWKNGQLNAHNVGKGVFVSPDMTRMRISHLQTNTIYREKIEKAQRMAGYIDKGLIIAHGLRNTGASNDALNNLFRQNNKAAEIINGKRNGNNEKSLIVSAD
jgi:hypothetical protein